MTTCSDWASSTRRAQCALVSTGRMVIWSSPVVLWYMDCQVPKVLPCLHTADLVECRIMRTAEECTSQCLRF